MTGIERLRDIVDDGPYSGGMIHISVQKLREICEQIEAEADVETVKAEAIRAADNRRVELCAALGIDTDTGWSDAMAEMVKRLMPEGMSWPRYEDGEPVNIGCLFAEHGGCENVVDSVEVGDCWFTVHGFDGAAPIYGKGASVKRPAPKVLDADGAEIRVGDTVWSTKGEFDGKRTVSSMYIDPGEPPYAMFEERRKPYSCLCCCLTHRAPVLAADGRPLREGETVYVNVDRPYDACILTGDAVTVVEAYEENNAVVKDGKDASWFIDADQLTHERPDNWERWIEDAGKSPCEYFGSFGPSCDGCQHDPCMCDNDKDKDLVRRAKAIVERGQR